MATVPTFIEYIDADEVDYLFTKPSQIANAGLGLYTAIPIYKNELISIFYGDVLTKEEAQNRIDLKQDGYFINLLNGEIMDSIYTECFAKFANDAEGGILNHTFKNNAIITLNDEDVICIVATKNIKANEEIFVSYGKAYWSKLHL